MPDLSLLLRRLQDSVDHARAVARRAATSADQARVYSDKAGIREMRHCQSASEAGERVHEIAAADPSRTEPPMIGQHDRCSIVAAVRAKLAARSLPADAPKTMWGGNGRDNVCSACDAPITSDDYEFEVDMADGLTFSFHRDCLAVWQDERMGVRPTQ